MPCRVGCAPRRWKREWAPMVEQPDPRFLAGENAVLTDVSKMQWVLAAGWDGAVDVHANISRKDLAAQLRFLADQWDPPS